MSAPPRRGRLLAVIGPGLLVAATGVGAGDLATAGFAGMHLGTAVLWAVVLGAFFKFVLTEGLARWQLATGETILEGAVTRLGRGVSVVFLLYLLPWSFFVGAALISACGVTMHAILEPLGLFPKLAAGKIALGVAHSLVGVVAIWLGGFRLFERVMAVCVAVMFASVVITAVRLAPGPGELAAGLVVPRIPRLDDGGLAWTIALIGGVGGTLTIICYGYWIREEGRTSENDVRTCRLDLAVGYAVTALFGVAMVVIARDATLTGKGAGLIVTLGDQLARATGGFGRGLFLAGAWAAVFSSLLGVWQAVPYIFADFVRLHRRGPDAPRTVDVRGWPYRGFLLALATVPLLQVHHPFRDVQRYYAIMGAAFLPLLAVVLLLLNGRASVIGPRHRNRPTTNVLLVLVIGFFLLALAYEVRQRLSPPPPPVGRANDGPALAHFTPSATGASAPGGMQKTGQPKGSAPVGLG